MSMIELPYFRKKFHNESMVGQFVFPYTSATYECILQIQEYESISSKSLKNDTYQTSANSGSKFTISDASEKKIEYCIQGNAISNKGSIMHSLFIARAPTEEICTCTSFQYYLMLIHYCVVASVNPW